MHLPFPGELHPAGQVHIAGVHVTEQGRRILLDRVDDLHRPAQVIAHLGLDPPGHIQAVPHQLFAVVHKGQRHHVDRARHGDLTGAGGLLDHRFRPGRQRQGQGSGQAGGEAHDPGD